MKFYLFKSALALMNALPLGVVHWLGSLIGQIAWLANGDARRTVETNLRLCFPELDQEARTELAKKSLAEAGKTILEGGKMWRGDPDKLLTLMTSSDGESLIDEARRQDRGVILAIPHCGCWETVSFYIAKHYPMTGMFKARNRPGFDELVRDARERVGAKLVPTNASGIRAMGKALKKHELVVLMPDQTPTGQGEFADFFGHPAYTMTLLPRLAKSTNAVVLFAFARRLPGGKGYQLVVRQAEQDIAALETRPALEAVNCSLADLIREAPEQYWWLYKRFKKQPDGYPPVYDLD